MAEEQIEIKADLGDKPIFADEIGVGVRVKVLQNEKGGIEKEGLIDLTFINIVKRQALGEFIITKATASSLSKILYQTLEQLETELASKEAPKQPELKTTGGDISIYR